VVPLSDLLAALERNGAGDHRLVDRATALAINISGMTPAFSGSVLYSRPVYWRCSMAKDPVCGMEVNESQAKAKAQHGGKTSYFCSVDCQKRFEQNPERYSRQTA
jgi:YHS domain-containing protein